MTREEIIEKGQVVYKKPTLLNDTPMHYCPGCSHGVVHKLVSEVIEEMGMTDKTIAISPVGCAVFAYKYIDVDWQEAAHGRVSGRTDWSSPTRVTVTLPASVQRRPSTL